MNKTGIDYCDFTFNPTHGCSHAGTPGCDFCWARNMSKRLAAMGAKGYAPDDPFKVVCMPDKLNEPLKRKKPAIIAVSFMGDLHHPDVPVEFIDRVVGVMALATQHRFIILTKRAERMHDYFTGLRDDPKQAWRFEQQSEVAGKFHKAAMTFRRGKSLPNVIGMVTVENPETADKRIPWLLKTPFAMRGVSAEPLLSELDLTQVKVPDDECQLTTHGYLEYHFNALDMMDEDRFHNPPSKLDWCIVGGESSSGARPMHPQWARNLRDQCVETGTPFFFKQWGEWIRCETSRDVFNHETKCFETIPAGLAFKRVGKKKAGHLLDGEEWHQMPEGMKL